MFVCCICCLIPFLTFVSLLRLCSILRKFWPRHGSAWDRALAAVSPVRCIRCWGCEGHSMLLPWLSPWPRTPWCSDLFLYSLWAFLVWLLVVGSKSCQASVLRRMAWRQTFLPLYFVRAIWVHCRYDCWDHAVFDLLPGEHPVLLSLFRLWDGAEVFKI